MKNRFTVLLVGAAMAAMMLAFAGIASAQAVGTSPVINPTPDATPWTNGIVYSMVRSGDHIYVGGKFTRVRSPNGTSYAATNVARFDADTGAGDRDWTPDVTGADTTTTRVYALAATENMAADGTVQRKIWVGGKFNAVDGIARRNLAAVTEGGVVDADVDPAVGSETNEGVRALVASGNKVYAGGYFLQVDGKARRYLAAFDSSGNLDTAWKPKTDRYVRSLAVSPCDPGTVFAGGKFRTAAGSLDSTYSPREMIARFDATTGALDAWSTPAGASPNDAVAADLPITCERITAAYLGPNRMISYRLDDGNTGSVVWDKKSGGDVQTAAMLGPNKIVIGGHFGQFDGQKRTGLALINLADGTVDTANWSPSPELTATNFVSVWETYVDENHVYVGGTFSTVAGESRPNYARFALTP